MSEGERFQRAFQDAAIGIALLAVEPLGKYLEVNPTFCRMTGYSREELLARDFQSITASQDINKNLDQLQLLLQGTIPSLQLEKQYLRKDAIAFWARLNVSLVRDNRGTPQYFIVQIEDIDERKRAEEAFRSEEKRLLLTIEQIPAVLWTTDTELRFTMSVGAGLAGLGLAPNQVVGMTLFEFFQTTNPEVLPIQAARRALNGESVSYETVWKDRVFQSRVEPLRDGTGHIIGMIGFALDITERKRSEDRLKFMQFSVDHASDAAYWLTPDARFVDVNDSAALSLGYTREELLTMSVFDIDPDFPREAWSATWSELKQRGSLTLKTRHRTKSGRIFPVEINANYLEFGGKEYNCAFARDISERRRAEEAVRESQERYRNVVELSPEAIFINKGGRIVFANSACLRLLGAHTADQLLGKSPLEIVHPDYHEAVRGLIQRLLERGGDTPLIERKWVRLDGTPLDVEVTSSALPFEGGTAIQVLARDITARKQVEKALRASEERLGQAIRVSDIGIFDHDHLADTVYWSPAQRRIYGWGPDEPVTLQGFLARVHPGDADRITAAVRKAHDPAGDGAFDVEHRTVRPDGEIRWVATRSKTFFEGEGGARRPVRTVGAVIDITERKRAEEALQNSETRNRALLDAVPDIMFRINRDGLFLDANQAKGSGPFASPMEFVGKNLRDVMLPDIYRMKMKFLKEAFESGEIKIFEYQLPDNGNRRDYEARFVVSGQDEVIAIVRDITERKRAEEALQASEERFRASFKNAVVGMGLVDRSGRFIETNRALSDITGYSEEELKTLTFRDITHPDDLADNNAIYQKMMDEKREGIVIEKRYQRKDGKIVWVTVSVGTIYDMQGNVTHSIGLIEDITERKRAEEALRESSQFNQQIITNAREGIIVYDRDLRYVVWNPFMEELTGLRAEKVFGKRPRDLPSIYQNERGKLLMDKKTVENIEASIKRALTGETFSYLDVPFIIKETGAIGWTSVRYGPFRNAQGEIVGVIATVWEITERKRLEEQLQHAQKLEAVGQLAGGVAHEFNNMLTAIIGNLDLAIGQVPPESDQHPTLTVALQAARRAAMLTQQLLTFSHRSPMDPQPQDLGGIATEVVNLLRQTIDRRIQVSVRTGDGLWPVLADAGQMHQVIMNLCVNARDSLIERIETAAPPSLPPGWEPEIAIGIENVQLDEAYCKQHYDARPGEYVCLSINDNGCGIDENVRHRIFEPFFTTKEVGRGTGLGLAAVYGIIKQHQGWIDLSSSKNVGTTFRSYLPRTQRPAVPTLQAVPAKEIARGSETILFVDDEASIRRLGQTILEHHGYTVLLAKNGEEALETFQHEHDRIRLVVLDLTMPRMSGREVLKRLLQIDPKIRVLISTGHHVTGNSNELQSLGMVELVPKPYRPDDLARSVRKLLDTSASPQRQAT